MEHNKTNKKDSKNEHSNKVLGFNCDVFSELTTNERDKVSKKLDDDFMNMFASC